MTEELQRRIERAKELLKTVRHAAMATVNEDGSPHNTPYFFICDKKLSYLYWNSHPDAQHSKNVKRSGQIFVALYEAGVGGGLYMKAEQAKQLEGKELEQALEVQNKLRATINKVPLPLSYFQGDNPQRMYSAVPVQFWVNISERDRDGNITRDYRHEISKEELVGGENGSK